jgi:hypothetical protein
VEKETGEGVANVLDPHVINVHRLRASSGLHCHAHPHLRRALEVCRESYPFVLVLEVCWRLPRLGLRRSGPAKAWLEGTASQASQTLKKRQKRREQPKGKRQSLVWPTTKQHYHTHFGRSHLRSKAGLRLHLHTSIDTAGELKITSLGWEWQN